MARKPVSNEQIVVMLAETPQRLAALTAGLSAAQLRTAPAEGEWSANEVLAHLRACADVWGGCIRTIVTEDEPTIRAVNPRTWMRTTDYVEQEFEPSLRAFAAQRAELVAFLEGLQPDDWARPATVTGAGKRLVRTVRGYAQWLAEHERPHVKQIARLAEGAER